MDQNTFAPAPDPSVLIEAAATLLGVSRRTVYYRIRDGRLRTIRTRNGSQRVLRSSLDALMREQVDSSEDEPGATSMASSPECSAP